MSERDYVLHDLATETAGLIQHMHSMSREQIKNSLQDAIEVMKDSIEDSEIRESVEMVIYDTWHDSQDYD